MSVRWPLGSPAPTLPREAGEGATALTLVTRRRVLQLTAAAAACLSLNKLWAGGGALSRFAGEGRGGAEGSTGPFLAHISTGAAGDAAAQGALLATEEAARAAELLGTHLVLRSGSLREAASLIAQGALALIGGLDAATRADLAELAVKHGVPLLTTRAPGDASTDEPLHEHVFHVASGPRDRREAMERWKAREKAPDTEDVEIADWHPSLERFGAEQLNQRYRERFGSPMEPLAWASWMGVKAAAEAVLRGAGTPAELSHRLVTLGFDGHKGMRLRFRPEDHHLRQPLYVVGKGRVLAEISPEEESE